MADIRLIDANALRVVLKNEECDCEVFPWAVDNAPTVDATPVVHGEWLDGGAVRNGKEVYKSIDCSVCEEYFKIESYDREYWKARFKVCPFCGAKMDLEVTDNG